MFRLTRGNMQPYSKIIELLNSHNVKYQEITHGLMYTSAEEEAVTGLPSSHGAKSLLLKTQQSYVLAVLPGDKKLDFKKIKKNLNTKRLRLAIESEIMTVMQCKIGACHPFGKLAEIKTVIDPLFEKNEVISFNPGEQDRSIIMQYKDFIVCQTAELSSISQEN